MVFWKVSHVVSMHESELISAHGAKLKHASALIDVLACSKQSVCSHIDVATSSAFIVQGRPMVSLSHARAIRSAPVQLFCLRVRDPLCSSARFNMPVVSEMQHPKSLSFHNQRRLFVLRKVQKQKWAKVLPQLVTLDGKTHPSERQCRDVLKAFSVRLGRRVSQYKKCGRKKWKVTSEVRSYIIQRLLVLRKTQICISVTLQGEVAVKKGITLASSTIRKVLEGSGYEWLPRSQKPKYSKEEKARRVGFGQEVLAMPEKELQRELTMSMDGVVVSLPPTDKTQRENYCRVGETHCYRKRSEGMKPELAGGDKYSKQVPYARAIPLWGGIGKAGFGLVMFHQWKKVNSEEWCDAVSNGQVVAACRDASGRKYGPWCLLCDNESFLSAKITRAAHLKARITLWHVPPRSPDLNPVEQFWGKLRLWLRQMDLADLKAGRPPVQKTIMKERVRRLLRSARAKALAQKIFKGFRRKCQCVVDAKGAAIHG